MISVIVPTYNEATALPILVRRLHVTMDSAQIPYELIVVDDNSPDGTAQVAERMASEAPIKVLRRPGKAGLASAVLHGLQLAKGDLIAVMDADLSHPPETIPQMLRAMESSGAELAVASRYVRGGGIENWPFRRRLASAVANALARILTPIRDATSGFFLIRRSCLDGVQLNPIGFKIGLEVMARARYRRFIEVPYVFTDRRHGTSKFGSAEVWFFLKQLAVLRLSAWRGSLQQTAQN